MPIDWWLEKRQKTEHQVWRLSNFKDRDTLNKWKGEETDLLTRMMHLVCTHDQFKLPVEYHSEDFKEIRNEALKPQSDFNAKKSRF